MFSDVPEKQSASHCKCAYLCSVQYVLNGFFGMCPRGQYYFSYLFISGRKSYDSPKRATSLGITYSSHHRDFLTLRGDRNHKSPWLAILALSQHHLRTGEAQSDASSEASLQVMTTSEPPNQISMAVLSAFDTVSCTPIELAHYHSALTASLQNHLPQG